MKSILFSLVASLLLSSGSAFAAPQASDDCHPGTAGRCYRSDSYPGFAWYRTDSGSIQCYAIEAPAGSSPSPQNRCSPHGFAFYIASNGNNYCYSVDAPSGTDSVDASYCL